MQQCTKWRSTRLYYTVPIPILVLKPQHSAGAGTTIIRYARLLLYITFLPEPPYLPHRLLHTILNPNQNHKKKKKKKAKLNGCSLLYLYPPVCVVSLVSWHKLSYPGIPASPASPAILQCYLAINGKRG